MDHQSKLAWALTHLDALDAAIEKFIQSDVYEARLEYDVDAGCSIVRLYFSEELPPDFSLSVGDIVHNLRSALDNLAYALSVKFKGAPTEQDAKNIQFLICDTRAEWCDPRRRRFVSRLSPDVEIAMERLQPYNRTDRRFKHPLSVIRDLSNIDKHRHLHITRVTAEATSVELSGPDVPPGTVLEGYRGPLKNGTEIARWAYITPPQSEVEVRPKAQFGVSFGDGPAFGGGVTALLRASYVHIRHKVLPELEAFL